MRKNLEQLSVGLVCLVVAGLLSPRPAAAGYKAGGGYFEIKVDGALKLKTQQINWVWLPFFADPFSLDVFARCVRKNSAGVETGKNKVFFQNLRISSLNANKIATFKKLKAKMKSGDTGFKGWDAGFMETLHADGPALGSVDVVIKGKLNAGDRVTCMVDVNEGVFGFTENPASGLTVGSSLFGSQPDGHIQDSSSNAGDSSQRLRDPQL